MAHLKPRQMREMDHKRGYQIGMQPIRKLNFSTCHTLESMPETTTMDNQTKGEHRNRERISSIKGTKQSKSAPHWQIG